MPLVFDSFNQLSVYSSIYRASTQLIQPSFSRISAHHQIMSQIPTHEQGVKNPEYRELDAANSARPDLKGRGRT
jgi:hypothetical protein